MREYNWQKEKQSMRGNAGSASSRQDQNVPVSRQEHIAGQSIFLFLLLVVLLLATGIWWWMKAGSSGDSAKALAAVAESGIIFLLWEEPAAVPYLTQTAA